ncbi:hypothetical protein NDN08_006173 [Rhodosorus marinus]|uniref:Uroporphyrinogen decarboxylase n=1 Tax=Rhodosorus marinus TaxID=101924 RepID=A0AAV8UJY2_9RHOD|nr:hypothetical protein NDN08_006173 [Rhodosorus marinus]
MAFVVSLGAHPGRSGRVCMSADQNGKDAPILLRAARGELVERPPVWLMRQAGRYMEAFREYSDKYSFRHRSETPEIAIELSLQPWRAFQTDGVIMFSDILTPLPAIGIEFDMVRGVGPRISNPVRSFEDLQNVTAASSFNPERDLSFVGTTLNALRDETAGKTTLLGFVGCPWTLAAYSMEGKGDKNLMKTKKILFSQPDVAHQLLDTLADVISKYIIYQIEQGAQVVQLFDSWAHHLSPEQYEKFSLPYTAKVVTTVKAWLSETGRSVPLIFFANGCGGKLELIKHALQGKVDVIQVDWSVNIADARERLGPEFVIQGNVDPLTLLGAETVIKDTVTKCCEDAGRRHILNLGHGVVQGTPESAVDLFCQTARNLKYAEVVEKLGKQ